MQELLLLLLLLLLLQLGGRLLLLKQLILLLSGLLRHRPGRVILSNSSVDDGLLELGVRSLLTGLL